MLLLSYKQHLVSFEQQVAHFITEMITGIFLRFINGSEVLKVEAERQHFFLAHFYFACWI